MNRLFALSGIVCVFLVVGCTSSGNTSAERPAHHTDNGFKNLYIEDGKKSFFSYLNMRWFGDDPWADHKALSDTVPIQPVDLERLLNPPEAKQITWLGHATFLIQIDGINILTDPIFSDYASPLSFAGPKRYVAHTVDYEKLPPIDHVVISHNHYDHLDQATLPQLKGTPTFHVPLKLGAWFRDNDIDNKQIREYDWWDSQQIGSVAINALPSQHWSGRSLTDRYETLWASWAVTINGYRVWFAGDTGYNDQQFKAIGKHLGVVDLALIPIGAYEPRWFMKQYHVNPQEAIYIHQDINASLSVGIHWGTFPLTAEAPIAPKLELERLLLEQPLQHGRFITMIMGDTRSLLTH